MEVIYIGAVWCKTCTVIKPKVQELCMKFSVSLKIMDYDNDLDEEQQATITKVPTLQINKDKDPVVMFNVNQVASLEAWLQANVSLTAADDF